MKEQRTYTEIQTTEYGIEPVWPTEYWWCATCGEPCAENPCQHCGDPVSKYLVVLADAR